MQGHPLLPVLQVTENTKLPVEDVDLHLTSGTSTERARSLFDLLLRTAEGQHIAASWQRNNLDFQVSRGRFGVST